MYYYFVRKCALSHCDMNAQSICAQCKHLMRIAQKEESLGYECSSCKSFSKVKDGAVMASYEVTEGNFDYIPKSGMKWLKDGIANF